ncbi:MAG: RNA polymerase sigma factor [Bacteroidales bacterium]|nr:RNA polymerase sigma factor [Bacteroidales bacterium]
MTEGEYIKGLKRGDEKVYREFVDQYQLSLLRLCIGFLHDEEDAKDIVQDVFVEVFRSVEKFRGDASLSTWLYRIAVNKSLNQIQRNRKRRLLAGFNSIWGAKKQTGDDIPDESDISDIDMEKKERAKFIRKAIDLLPKNQRIAFILSKYEDLSNHDISEVMGISLSAAESLIHRAKLGLQKRLSGIYKKF